MSETTLALIALALVVIVPPTVCVVVHIVYEAVYELVWTPVKRWITRKRR